MDSVAALPPLRETIAAHGLDAKKRFGLGSKRSFELGVDIFNLFNAINFLAVAQASASPTINQVTQSYQDPNVTFDPGGRLMQLVFRFNF